jgi:hypothetical protein
MTRRRRIQNFILFALAAGLSLAPAIAHACATCYGAADSPQTQGLNMAIATLLGVTGVVLSGFLTMIVCLARRARRFAAGDSGNALPPATEVTGHD